MTHASLQSGVPFVQALQLLFRPSHRRVEAGILWPRLRLALSMPLAIVGIACILVAAANWHVLNKLMAENTTVIVTDVPAPTNAEGHVIGIPTQIETVTKPVTDAFVNHKIFANKKTGEGGIPFNVVIVVLSSVGIVGGLVLLASSGLAWRRKPGALKVLRKFYVVGYIVPLIGIYVAGEAMNVLIRDGIYLYEKSVLTAWWTIPIKLGLVLGLLVTVTLLVLAHLLARSDEAADIYQSEKIPRQNLGILYAGTGRDRRVRTTQWQSLGVHAVAILVLPWLLIFGAWTAGPPDYAIPGGGGGGSVEQTVTVKVQQKPKRKRTFVTNYRSAIIFESPDMDRDTEVQPMVEEQTSATYSATGVGPGRGPGKGPGTGPGWGDRGPGTIRFIRLEHGGKAWDDGMTNETGRADMNFLEEWRDLGFQISPPESMPIAALKTYQHRRERMPPFVFITGQSLTGLTTADYQTLKKYCEDGGMLFVDSAGPAFDRDFRDLMRNHVFPGQPLSDIPNDDPIFREPYYFPTGAPMLWPHGANPRALGIRAPNSSRLCVFYYPGDLHDAWKSGHSGLSQDKAKRAMQLGINVVNYAISNYVDMYPGK